MPRDRRRAALPRAVREAHLPSRALAAERRVDHAILDRLVGHGPATPELEPTADGPALVIGEPAIRAMYSGCPDADIADARERLTPLPLEVATAPVVTTPEWAGWIPRTYIECAADNAFPIAE